MRTPAPSVPNSLYWEVKHMKKIPYIDYKAIPEFCSD